MILKAIVNFLKPLQELRNYQQLLFYVIIFLLSGYSADREPVMPFTPGGNFTNPVLDPSPDPWVFQKDGWYYFTHTTGKSLKLYRTREMSALKEAEVQTIWTPPASGMNSKHIWAPEIHFVNDKWYFYYAADNGKNENHRLWVLENASADPFTDTWVDKGKVELPDDKWAIDGSIFSHKGQLYFVWSGWEGDTNISQDIYITAMTNPWTAQGERVRISRPELDWELKGGSPNVNEGPQFLSSPGKVFIVYSASGCWTDDYAIGLLSANSGSSLLDPASWTKSLKPLFVNNPSAQAFGPGHNSFFKSPDGTEDWLIYHANAAAGQGCADKRSTRMQKFTWTSSGFPDLGVPVPLGTPLPVPSGEN